MPRFDFFQIGVAVADKKKLDRAKARSAAKRGDQLKFTRENLKRPSRVVEAGVTPYAVVKLAEAGVKAAQRAVAAQNKAAKTYISKSPRTEAQKAADARNSARMKKVNKEARRAPYYKAAAGASATAAVIGGPRKPQATSNKSVQGAAKKASKDSKRPEVEKKSTPVRAAEKPAPKPKPKATGRGQVAAAGVAAGTAAYKAASAVAGRAKKASRNVNPASVRAKAEAKKKKK